jgi:hypothetical protein
VGIQDLEDLENKNIDKYYFFVGFPVATGISLKI